MGQASRIRIQAVRQLPGATDPEKVGIARHRDLQVPAERGADSVPDRTVQVIVLELCIEQHEPAARSRSTRCTSATLLASRMAENMLSPKKAPLTASP